MNPEQPSTQTQQVKSQEAIIDEHRRMYINKAAQQFGMESSDLKRMHLMGKSSVEGDEFVAHKEITGVVNGVRVNAKFEGRAPNKPGMKEGYDAGDRYHQSSFFDMSQSTFRATLDGQEITGEDANNMFLKLENAAAVRDARDTSAMEAVRDTSMKENEQHNHTAESPAPTQNPESTPSAEEKAKQELLARVMGKKN